MSADNWAICPRCFERAEEKYTQVQQRIADLDDDIKQFTKVAEPDGEDYRTFREDYEFYIPGPDTCEPGEYVVKYSYHGECGDWFGGDTKGCGLRVSFSGEQEIPHG